MARLIALAGMVALLSACGGPSRAPAELPSEPPYMTGAITAIDEGSIRVEADPGGTAGSQKAMLRLTPETQILWRTGERADQGDLRLGTVVSAWISGPILESYPIQATVDTVVIESTTRPGAPQA